MKVWSQLDPHLLGYIDIWTRPSSRGQLEKPSNFLFHDQFYHATNFRILETLQQYVMRMINELLPRKIGVFFLAHLDEVRHPQRGHFGRFSLSHGASNMCTSFSPNLFCLLLHNHHLVLRGKNHTQIGHHMWKILAPTFWVTHGTASQKKQCQTNKNSYMLELWGFYMLFWPTW